MTQLNKGIEHTGTTRQYAWEICSKYMAMHLRKKYITYTVDMQGYLQMLSTREHQLETFLTGIPGITLILFESGLVVAHQILIFHVVILVFQVVLDPHVGSFDS